ncbi:aldo-keto reductase [Aureococcus anophagefferens]|uniref:Aldo-keto reductase n=1 Tax=Aureococcus anophagefferens TaxID=44056 RepID=A0ABR1G983_AURAN
MAEAAPDAADAAAPVAGPDAAARRDESGGDAASESVELVERAKSAAVLGRDLEADAAAALVETATGYIPPWAWRFRRLALEALGGDPEHVLHRMLLDVLAIFASFVAAGVVVFHATGAGSGDRRWRPGYCLYRFARHSINIGFAVGSAPRMAATPAAKVFTILYCVYGNAIVVSALQLLRRAAALRELGRADLAADSRYGMFLLLTPYFLVSLALSMVVAKLFAGYGEAVDMIIFAASHLLFSSYEALEDGGAAAAEETRWSRGRARAFRALGLDGAVQRCAADLGLIFLAPAKLCTVVYSLLGNMLIINSLGLLDRLATVRSIERQSGGAAGWVRGHKYGLLAALSALYGATLVFAGLVARYAARYDKFLDCLLFAVTNSMTCGLLYGQPSSRDWWWTTASVVLSVPAAAAWCSELAHLVFLEYENNEAALYAIASKKAGARREGEELG